jgi:bifunctional non-homologous end joining protein LigD
MSTLTTLPSISLYYKEGTSDKEYHLTVIGDEKSGYKVEYRFGKRGSKLRTAFKNKAPVDLNTATEIYNSNLNSQLREGYTTGVSGTPYVGTENSGKVSGLLPHLLTDISEDLVQKYLSDNDWVMEEKKDGVRQMIRKSKKVVEGINKKGLIVSIPETTADAIAAVCGLPDATLDGELIGEHYWLFDVLAIDVHSFTNKTVKERLEAIREWFGDEHSTYFHIVPTAVGKASKEKLFKQLKEQNAEGVVFKKLDSLYKAGRGNSQVKFKFKGSATVRCKSLNDKNSFVMEMLSKGDWTEIGNCTYFPGVLEPIAGKFYEIEYLYAYREGSLFQPTLKELRTDADEDDCLVSQLKYKQGT